MVMPKRSEYDTLSNAVGSHRAPPKWRLTILTVILFSISAFALVLATVDRIKFPAADMSSYVNLGQSFRSGHYYEALANTYWSPLYPAILSFGIPADGNLAALQ